MRRRVSGRLGKEGYENCWTRGSKKEHPQWLECGELDRPVNSLRPSRSNNKVPGRGRGRGSRHRVSTLPFPSLLATLRQTKQYEEINFIHLSSIARLNFALTFIHNLHSCMTSLRFIKDRHIRRSDLQLLQTFKSTRYALVLP